MKKMLNLVPLPAIFAALIHTFSTVLALAAVTGALATTYSENSVVITNAPHSVVNKDTITISGNGFGVKNPVGPFQWEDLETGSPNGEWDAHYDLTVVSTQQRNGSKYCGECDTRAFVKYLYGTNYKEFYSSAWFYVPADFRFIGGTNQIKVFRIYGRNDPIYPNIYWATRDNYSDMLFAIEHGYTRSAERKMTTYVSGTHDYIPAGEWTRLEMYYKLSSATGVSDGEIEIWVDGKSLWHGTDVTSDNTFNNLYDYRWSVPGTVSGVSANPLYDDIYLDVSRARIELSTASTWSEKQLHGAHCEIQLPGSWNNEQITFAVNQGSFNNGDAAYLYVMNPDGDVNENGYPLRFQATDLQDVDPPYTSAHNPASGTTEVPANSDIVVHVQDDWSGVDQSSIVMTVEGNQVSPAISGTPADYTLTYDPPEAFNYDQIVDITIDAKDLSSPPNIMTQDAYSFGTESISPPVSEGDNWQQNHPDWVFFDDFETGTIEEKYDGGRRTYTEYIDSANQPQNVYRGNRAMQFSAIQGTGTGAGIYKIFDTGSYNGPVYARWYTKFSSDFNEGAAMHFVGLLGIDFSKSCVGCGANQRPAGDELFSTFLEPYPKSDDPYPPGGLTLYSYFSNQPYENYAIHYKPDTPFYVERGKWYCMETMIKPNTPGKDDGEQAFWVDGNLVAHFTIGNSLTNEGFIWRTVDTLKINTIWLQLYIHNSPQLNRVWFDNLVVSKNYIGPVDEGDSTSPTIAITEPVSAETYSTTENTIALRGNSSDNAAVTSVTWANSRGGTGTASGTTVWSVSGISLKEGENVITVTAQDGAGNTADDILAVTYTVPVTDISPPMPPSGLAVGD